MKYVALLSGGKDSCYNLVHCERNGHELVAAASLGPELGKEELDSYLYQTVGQDAIEFVASALEVPLYRQIISGTAVEQGAEYGGRNANDKEGVQGDETEDLYTLLSTVKLQHPEIQGVSVGAILSNYQRVRVEHVCSRLALTPLCYLWQMDQGELLSEMIDAGMEAILIKVAGIGLTTDHLGKNLAQMQPLLIKLNTLYGSHICGEGGEYESLTLDCPLFKQRIILHETETVIHSDSDFATVAFLRIKNATLQPKPSPTTISKEPRVLLDDAFMQLYEELQISQKTKESHPPESSKKLNSWVAVSGVCRSLDKHPGEVSIEAEVEECFQGLIDQLSKHSLNLSQCTNINVYISSMDLFFRMNSVYATYFSASPPARACVAVDLPFPYRVKLDCIAYVEKTSVERQALHVQGLSYWAPANIGPYSQAITVDERVFISGQIGMIPSSLSLPQPQSATLETALAFQHVEHVADVLRNNSGGGWLGHFQGIIYWLTDPLDIPHVVKAHTTIHPTLPPTLYLVVKGLPKNACVEKQVLLHTGRCSVTDEYNESNTEICIPICKRSFVPVRVINSTVDWSISYFEETGAFCAIICIKSLDSQFDGEAVKANSHFKRIQNRSLSVRLFYSCSGSPASDVADLFGHAAITQVPCRIISTEENNWDYAMYIIGN